MDLDNSHRGWFNDLDARRVSGARATPICLGPMVGSGPAQCIRRAAATVDGASARLVSASFADDVGHRARGPGGRHRMVGSGALFGPPQLGAITRSPLPAPFGEGTVVSGWPCGSALP